MLSTPAAEIAIALGLIVSLAIAGEVGYRFGGRVSKDRNAGGGQLGAIQGAILGLLALLLGFSFSGAASRFMERQDLIVQEANAIGTAYLRADLLDEVNAGKIRQTLAEYVRYRVAASKSMGGALQPEAEKDINALHVRLWAAARDGVLARPAAAVVVLDPINVVIDLHATRVAAGVKQLPPLILALLIFCSLMAAGAIGYGCGVSGRRNIPLTASLALLMAAALWTTIDLDHPRQGLIRLSDAPLESLNLKP